MWIFYAFGSAFFAGITSVLAKIGIQHTDSNVATAIRTIVVLIFAWVMVAISGSFTQIHTISTTTLLFLCLSGFATGASWLFYFKALQIGNINKIAAIDKSSVILTILLSFLLFHEEVSIFKLGGMLEIGIGTYLMLQRKQEQSEASDNRWLLYAVLSVIFASLTTILGKIGIQNIESNLGSAIRTSVVLVMAWLVVCISGKQSSISAISKKELLFIGLSGLATGCSWLCFYKALQSGPASLVVPIDKMSIVITVCCSYIIFHEHSSKKTILGLFCIVVGTLTMLLG